MVVVVAVVIVGVSMAAGVTFSEDVVTVYHLE